MQPINKYERRNAFWNFLLLLSICFAIIITMVFFSVRVPLNDNGVLRAKLDALEKEVEKDREFSVMFTKKMISVSRMLDSINRSSPQEADILEETIGIERARLNSMVPDTLKNNKDLYVNVVHNMGQMQQYLKELRKKGDSDIEKNNYKSLYEKEQEKAQQNFAKYIECATKK